MNFNLVIFTVLLSINLKAFSAQISNYLGDGKHPELQLVLSANAPKWQSFTINYQGTGKAPYPTNSALYNWSTWDVLDTDAPQNYYGTITLTSDGKLINWVNYGSPQPANGFYLKGIHFCLPYSINPKCPSMNVNYALTVDEVITSFSSPSPFPNTPIATPLHNFSLKTNSNNIIDNLGNTIKIKGVVRPSLEWNTQGQNLSKEDIVEMKKFGANAIRLDINANYWNKSEPETKDGSYRQIINAIVYYATIQNMLVILDYHWSNDIVKQEKMAPANTTTIKFWKSVANQYKDFGNVLFELYNEAHDISYDEWLYGNSQYEGMQQMYDIVRNEHAENLIIVGGLQWGYDLSFITLNKNNCNNNQENCFIKEKDGSLAKNLIYGSHPYNKYDENFAESNLDGVKNLYPIIYTEFGDNQKNDYLNGNWKNVYSNIMAQIGKDNINYTGFAWWIDNNQPEFPTLIQGDWQNPICINGGCSVKDDLINHPGTFFNFNKAP